MMDFYGFLCALLMGVTLGLIGGGGSILTVPILVYLFYVEPVLSTTYSLFIVGITSLVGSLNYIRKGDVLWTTVLVFGIPSIVAVFVTRYYILPAIPSHIFTVGDFKMSKSLFLLLLLSVLMIGSSITMIRNDEAGNSKHKLNYPFIVMEGAVVGLVTGLVGAGGGFLIIPALVILGKIPMQKAVGTSLLIIAFKSLIGFMGDLSKDVDIEWPLVSSISAVAILGIFIGVNISYKIKNEKLKPIFGYFTLVFGIYIILKELHFI